MTTFLILITLTCPEDFHPFNTFQNACIANNDKTYVKQSSIAEMQDFRYLQCTEQHAANVLGGCKKKPVMGCKILFDNGSRVIAKDSCQKYGATK